MNTEIEIQLLRDAQKGNELIAVALALLLRGDRPVTADESLEMLAVMDLYATTAFSEGTALPIRNVMSTLRACTAEDIDPKFALVALAAQHAGAGPDRQDALRWWRSHATEEELSDELRRLLRQLEDPDDHN